MAEPKNIMDVASMKPLLVKSKQEPVSCAFGLGGDGGAKLLLHKTKGPQALGRQLEAECPDLKNMRFGKALVDVDDDPKLVKLTVNRAVSGMCRRLVRTLKGTRPPKASPVVIGVDLDDLVPEEEANLREEDLNGGRIASEAKKIGAAAAQLVLREAGRPNSDVMFSLATINLNELRAGIGGALGLTGSPDGWPPNLRKLAEAAAQEVRDAVEANHPNRTSEDTVKLQRFDKQKGRNVEHDVPKTVAVNGVTYDNPEILGAGGFGLITRYRQQGAADPAPTVVMKSTLSSGEEEGPLDDFVDEGAEESDSMKGRREMVHEVKVHRAVTRPSRPIFSRRRNMAVGVRTNPTSSPSAPCCTA